VSNRAIKTFSVIFEEKAYDERAYAQIAARHIGTDHTELLLSGTDVRRHLKAALAAYDQPSQDGINTYFVSKVTREAGLTVALSGVGGDELFGGYNGYQKALAIEQWGKPAQQLPGPIKAVAANLLSFVTRQEGARKAANLLQSTRNPYFVTRQVFGPRQVAALLPIALLNNSNSWQSASFDQLERETAGYDAVNRVSALELQTYMLSTLLRDTDQMSMAHALEVRVPLIDHKLVEYLFTLPGACKIDKQQPKPLLTRALNGMLPMECVYRPKRGFEFPFAIWLRASFNEEMRTLFLGQSSQGTLPFTQSGLAQLWLDFERGYISWSRIWGIFVLCHWLTEQRVVL
jgi:asparagine synthase (glutamine-hydrolysing)